MRCILSISCCLVLSFSLFAQNKGYWNHLYDYIENTEVFEENQEEGRAYYIPATHLSLNGQWKFFWADIPEGIPHGFWTEQYNDRKWNNIKVPSNWEMEGYGDKQFRNMSTPFKPIAPKVPREYNPTGVYRNTFTFSPQWKNNQVFLRFEKVASASFVWINGQEVGYNEGAQEPAEYNVTRYLKPGKNTIAVAVTKYSDGYYLEGQDYWRLAGIFDDVCLYATPSTRLFDWQVVTDLDKDYRDARLDVAIDIKNYTSSSDNGNLIVQSALYDGGDRLVTELKSASFTINEPGKRSVSLSAPVSNPKKWTSETPDLYTLRIRLQRPNGVLVDSASVRIGFKKTEIIGEAFCLNGRPLKVNAMNSHMQHPELGHVMDEATIRKDFEILKKFNFNAVRISHYPPVNKYLELANEYGIYIIDEAGTEAHATEWVSGKKEYTEMYRERVRRMVLRDRNYPSVLFWSAGNESGEGFNISEVVKEGKRLDPTRYWMYGGNAFSHPAEDIIGPRYPVPMELEVQVGLPSGQADRRPSFMDEYLSVAGNGGGGMDDYWKVIYQYPRSLGGAIWDFVSPGLTEKVRTLYDASPNQVPANIMGNARLVKATHGKAIDLNGHDLAAVYDGKEMSLYIDGQEKARAKASGKIKNFPFPVNIGRNAEAHGQETSVYICDAILDNVGIFKEALTVRDLSGVESLFSQAALWLDFERETDGKVIEKGTLSLDVPALDKKQIRIPYTKPVVEAGKEYFIRFSSCLKTDERWAPTGYEVSWDQLPLPWYKPIEVVEAKLPDVSVSQETVAELTLTGLDFTYTFDKRTGMLTSMIYKGKELISEGLSMNIWRAPLANELDGWSAGNAKSPSWKEGYGYHVATEFYSTGIDDMTHIPVSFVVKEIAGKVIVNVRDIYLMKGNGHEKKDLYIEGVACNVFENNYEYTITGDGRIEISHTVSPNGTMPKWLPRMGLKLVLNKELNQVSWYGRGPQENYPDRKTGYKIGQYSSTVQDMYEPYLMPQDYGLRTDNRWVRVTDESGRGLQFKMDELFNFNVYPFSTDNLTKAMYTYQLHPFEGVTMNLDYSTSGVGCTARSILGAYRTMPEKYSRKVVLQPL